MNIEEWAFEVRHALVRYTAAIENLEASFSYTDTILFHAEMGAALGRLKQLLKEFPEQELELKS